MFRNFAFYFFLSAAVMLTLTSDIGAQYCIGSTGYQFRNEKGSVMSIDEMKGLNITVNRYPLKWYQAPDSTYPSFRYEAAQVGDRDEKYLKETRGGDFSNPLLFRFDSVPTFCGRINEVVLQKNDVVMRLIFDIRGHNTRYLIDSLPFQPGTFQLTSRKCKDGKPAPMIDNNTFGECFITADMWKQVERK